MPGAIFDDGSIYQVVDVPILAQGERLLLAVDLPQGGHDNYLVSSVRSGLFRQAIVERASPQPAPEVPLHEDRLLTSSDGRTELEVAHAPDVPTAPTWESLVDLARRVRGGGQ